MSERHTSGPWQTMDDYTREGGLTIIGDVDGEYFTDSAAPVMSYQFVASLEDEYGETHENTTANRRLILAAPELYEALRAFLDDPRFEVAVGGNPIAVDRMLSTARAALAKATGEQSQ